jgi:CRP-like cAMP-binding protein
MQTHDMAELLAAHPIFTGFDRASLDELAGCARIESWRAGATIFREGDVADALWLIRRGEVAVEIAAPGRAPLVVETLHAGDVLGWSWLLPPHRFMADALALSEAGGLRLDAACLRRECDEQPAIGFRFLKSWLPHLTERMRAQRLQMFDLYGADAD